MEHEWDRLGREMGWTLECTDCGHPAGMKPFSICDDCGGQVMVSYDASNQPDKAAWLAGAPHTIWGYSALLPRVARSDTITIGEGDTPLVLSHRLKRLYGRTVFWKNEAANPTLSHKDRFQSVAVSVAKALGYTGVVGTSTGNHGVSGVAYASVAGLRSLMFYPPEMSTAFLHLTSLYGGRAAVTSSESRTAAVDYVMAEQPGWYPVDWRNPVGIEGYKTIAYEIVRDLGEPPAAVVIPVGSGRLISGIHRGFEELLRFGIIKKIPRLVACQSSGVDVLTEPFESGQMSIPRRDNVQTVALSTKEHTADPRVLSALRASQGSIVVVGEAAVMDAVRELGKEGLAAEPASALVVAAIETLCLRDDLPAEAPYVGVVTSSLTKTPELLPEAASARPWRLGTSTRELADYLAAW